MKQNSGLQQSTERQSAARQSRRGVWVIKVAVALGLAAMVTVGGNTRRVRAALDRFVAVGGNDTNNDCSAPDAPCATIENAALEAEPGDTIHVGPGIYAEHVTLFKSLTVQGDLAGGTTVNGGNTGIVFTIKTGATAALNNLTITGGNGAGTNAGGIFSDADLLTVANCTISGNTASGLRWPGGGIHANRGALTVINSTISGNSYQGRSGAGGIATSDLGTVTIINSTISGNSGSTITTAGGILTHGATVRLTNTIVANNGLNCSGPIVSGGHNLSDNQDCFGGGGTDLIDTDPKLGPLQNNGGPTFTMALLAGSPAIDAGDDSVLGSSPFLTTDQRGAGFPRTSGSHVDIGAFELQQCFAPVVTLNPVNQNAAVGGSVTFTAAASGTPTPAVQWQVTSNGDVDFADIPGATGTTLSFTPTRSQSGNQYRAMFTNGCGTATTTAATLTVFDLCLKDDSTGNLFQFNSTTGQYQFTRCSGGVTLTGTGVVKLVNGIRTLTDFKPDRRISAGFNTGQMTGSATIYVMVAQGVWQSFRITSTNPAAVCKC